MGRKKAIKIPFLKIKLKSATIYSIFALVFLLFFVLTIFSFNQNALALKSLNEWLVFYFGKGAFFFPIIFLFAAGVLVQSKKLKVIKQNWFVGYIIVFISYLTMLNTGFVGRLIAEQASELLSRPGTSVTFFTLFLIGILIIFEISLQDFVKSFAQGMSTFMDVVRDFFAKFLKTKSGGKHDERREFVGENAEKQDALMKKPNLGLVKEADKAGAIEPFMKMGHIKFAGGKWRFPPLSLLGVTRAAEAERGDVRKNAHEIESALDSFGIKARVADINYGPAVTQYALQIARGVKLNKITSLSNNLALALAAPQGLIRIEAPIPGKALVGIEVPNMKSQVVPLKSMLSSTLFADRSKHLLVPLGLDVSGSPIVMEINHMPHILVAGTTGSGKSVMLSAWIATLLFRTTPEEVKLLLVDPKRVTFTIFDGIPHLVTNVITEPHHTVSALKWATVEMEDRYKKLAESRARDIFSYNSNLQEGQERLPFIIIIIDELADLMVHAAKEVEDYITRIAQKARAVGIYLILATQRPSVDVITGLMKANIPARIAFNVSSMIDSRVILDTPGAEKLLGRGDMLFLSPDQAKPRRIQGPYIDEKEIHQLVDFLKTQVPVVHYTEEVTEQNVRTMIDSSGNMTIKSDNKDPLFPQVVQLVCQTKKASASLLQRRFSIGYSRAARILDELEDAGIVGPSDASKPRDVLIKSPADVGL